MSTKITFIFSLGLLVLFSSCPEDTFTYPNCQWSGNFSGLDSEVKTLADGSMADEDVQVQVSIGSTSVGDTIVFNITFDFGGGDSVLRVLKGLLDSSRESVQIFDDIIPVIEDNDGKLYRIKYSQARALLVNPSCDIKITFFEERSFHDDDFSSRNYTSIHSIEI